MATISNKEIRDVALKMIGNNLADQLDSNEDGNVDLKEIASYKAKIQALPKNTSVQPLGEESVDAALDKLERIRARVQDAGGKLSYMGDQFPSLKKPDGTLIGLNARTRLLMADISYGNNDGEVDEDELNRATMDLLLSSKTAAQTKQTIAEHREALAALKAPKEK